MPVLLFQSCNPWILVALWRSLWEAFMLSTQSYHLMTEHSLCLENQIKKQKERALILQVNAAATCACCMWELRSVMSRPLNDALMSPCPELLFTGCPLPICQSELVSTVSAHGNERHLSLWYLMRDWGKRGTMQHMNIWWWLSHQSCTLQSSI